MIRFTLFLLFIISLEAKDRSSPMLMGVNALYWEEHDQLRSQKDYIETLKKLNIQTMRFPGGEVADNYDWRTNTLNNPNRWPTSKKDSDSMDRMDFNEFMQLQKKLGSEPIIVVNLENGFVTGNLEEAADIAAEWVRYANVEMGYDIKYWEVGNESYHMPTRYPLSAKEYARAFNLFAKKMKAVDPSIKLGANGPFNVNQTSLYDRLTNENQQKVCKIKNGKKRKKTTKKLLKQQSKKIKMKWWNIVFTKCQANIDFVALHHYITIRTKNSDMHKPLKIKQKIRKFKQTMQKKIGKVLPIFITEWNVWKNNMLDKKHYLLTIEEAMSEFEESNVKLIHFWPLRKSINWKNSYSYEEIYLDIRRKK